MKLRANGKRWLVGIVGGFALAAVIIGIWGNEPPAALADVLTVVRFVGGWALRLLLLAFVVRLILGRARRSKASKAMEQPKT